MYVVYIVGSYAPCDGRTEQENVTRAVALGALALTEGHIPIIPHVTIGCAALMLGDRADEIARQASYAGQGDGLAGWLGRLERDVEVWAIARDDGTYSKGTQAEVAAGRNFDGRVDRVYHLRTSATWAGWRKRFEKADLLDVYEAASKPGAAFPRWPGDTR
jgi:hypothetical protein